MAKDPAFLFYTKDWLSGCQFMSFEERGIYITLLCAQHQNGHLDPKRVGFLLGLDWDSVSVMVRDKFKTDSKGMIFNERLDEEIEKRANFIEKQRINGAKGGRPKTQKEPTGKPKHNPNTNPTGNAIGNGNEDKLNGVEIDFTQPDIEGDEVSFPLDTQPVRSLWAKWKESRYKNHKLRYKMMGEQAALKRLQGMTYQQIESTILAAISGGWVNLYPEKNGQQNGSSKNGEHPAQAAARAFAERIGNKSGQ